MPNKHDTKGRTKGVQVRFTPAEYEELISLMFRAKKRSPADYIRMRLELRNTVRIEAKHARATAQKEGRKTA
jgi:hypothetical protein